MLHLRALGEWQGTFGARELRAATIAIVGILALNGFLGRKQEWELMELDHIVGQMDAELDYVVCVVHKASGPYAPAIH